MTWFAYYWLIAGLKTFSVFDYGPRALVFDLANAVMLYFAVESLGNLGQKLAVEQDTTWFLLVLCLGSLVFRFLYGLESLQVPSDFRMRLRMERWMSAFFVVTYASTACIALAYLGFRYDRGSLEIKGVLTAIWSSVLLFGIVLCVPCYSMWRLERFASQETVHQPFWMRIVTRQRRLIRDLAITTVALEVLLYIERESAFDLLLRFRDAIPWSLLPLALILLVGIGWVLASHRSPIRMLFARFGGDAEVRDLCRVLARFLSHQLGVRVSVCHAIRDHGGTTRRVHGHRHLRRERKLQEEIAERVLGYFNGPPRVVTELVLGGSAAEMGFFPRADSAPDARAARNVVAAPVRFSSRDGDRVVDGIIFASVPEHAADALLQPAILQVFLAVARSMARLHQGEVDAPSASSSTELSRPPATEPS